MRYPLVRRPRPLARLSLSGLVALVVLLAACSPAAPAAPTGAPPAAAKPTEPANPAAAPSAAPAAEAKPAASPATAASPAAKPAASPVASPAPAGSPAPAAKPAAPAAGGFDEQAVASFYRGKTVRIIVGFSTGGGYDLYARLIARYFGKYIPGNPTVIVENMPGASGMLATSQVYNALPKDGTVINSFIGTTILQQLFGDKGVQYDMAKLQYIGAPTGDHYAMEMSKGSGITSFEQALGSNSKQLILGGNGPGVLSYDGVLLLKDVLGANIKAVGGYAGSADVKLAMLRGELDGTVNGWESIKARDLDDIQKGDIKLIMQWWDTPYSEMSNVPTVLTFAKTDEQRQLFNYGLILPSKFSRPYALAPEVPADRVRALDAAMQRTLADPELKADAEKAQLALDPLTGADVKKLVDDFMTISPDLVAKLKKSMVQS